MGIELSQYGQDSDDGPSNIADLPSPLEEQEDDEELNGLPELVVHNPATCTDKYDCDYCYHIKFLLYDSRFSGEPDSMKVLEELAEVLCEVAFAEVDAYMGRANFSEVEFIPVGERAKAGRLLLGFLCDMGYLPEGTTVGTLTELFCKQTLFGQILRNQILHEAILGEGRLAVWLEASEENRRKFWKAIRPGEPLPGEVPEATDKAGQEPLPIAAQRQALIEICGEAIANDLGNWDGARKARYWKLKTETSDWLRDSNNVKKLLPPGRRHGERAVNRHLSDSFGFTLGRKTLQKYGFISTPKQR